MPDYRATVGLVPIRRDCPPRPGQFNREKAISRVCRGDPGFLHIYRKYRV